MTVNLEEVLRTSRNTLTSASDLNALEQARVEIFGKKGHLSELLRGVGQLPQADRPKFGEKINKIRSELEEIFNTQKQKLISADEEASLKSNAVDITLPGRRPRKGSLHPLSIIERKMIRIFRSLGFSVAEGPDVETDYYNFEALNFPVDHPARDMQDTLFVEGGLVLRTHTSPVQIRYMEKTPPPVRIVIPGRVYRHDSDITHSPVFHQVEGLCVGPNVTFSDLKGTLQAFVHMIFGADIGTRFRPSFFPFTEPSAEVDMVCGTCKGKGCRVCKNTGWIEILGCGMVDPNVYGFVSKAWQARGATSPYDPEKISGFAFGMGVERIAMVLYGIDDIRLFFENDVRFLSQFGGEP